MKHSWRKPCCLVVFGALSWGLVAAAQVPAAQQRAAARRFLAHRSVIARDLRGSVALSASVSFARSRAAARSIHNHQSAARVQGGPAQTSARAQAETQGQLPANLSTTWHALGPQQIVTASYGAITGRVTSIAVDPADATGNTAYVGTTGGGVWKSLNAAGAAALVSFVPVTDDATPSDTGIPSLSIGAVSVQPGAAGVVLAGTGDPNDALDSYYGSGILRSTDHGATWTTVTDANLDDYATGQSFSFYGEGFSGFAWSTATADLVVAAVTEAYDGTVVNALQSNSVDGLYYSTDAGATWQMATLTDGSGKIFESPSTTTASSQGNAVTSVVWNPVRHAFYAAIRYHGYYSSPDGITWTRLTNQPGDNLSPILCPEFSASPGSVSCPIFRGALAVQPVTGDMFAFTVDGNLADQGIWQDVCAASGGNCSTSATVMFGTQILDTELQDGSGHIAQGDYNLWLAAVPSNADTLLYAGTEDIFKRSLAAANVPWRNTTNTSSCIAAAVAPAQHAVANGATGSLMYFGNDGGLWRTTDGIGQQQAACSPDDAAHFTNLNRSLGSLAEVTSLAQSPGNDATLLAGVGVNGTSGTTTGQGAWAQVLDGLGAYTAIDPANAQNWYMTSGPGVSISFCGSGGSCDPADFAQQPTIGDTQTASDGDSLAEPAVWMLDPQDPGIVIVGTCRLWRGTAAGGAVSWDAANAISPVLDDAEAPDCSEGAGQIQSIGASGTIAGMGGGQEILYAGMEGTPRGGEALPYGGLTAGHVFTATVSANQAGAATWTDLFPSPVLNDESNRGQFNPGGFGISSLVVDTHDTTGQTVYATIQGFTGNGISEPLVYRSTNQGQSWTNITANLPNTPVNALVVDPGNANIVYLGTDAGVYETTAVTTCDGGAGQCWSPYGTGLPNAPVTTLVTNGAANDYLLVAGTYGRGAWEMLLAGVCDRPIGETTANLTGADALVFGDQPIGTSRQKSVTITNSGSSTLCMTGTVVTGGFTDADGCTGIAILPGAACTVEVTFAPAELKTYSGVLTLTGNIPAGTLTAVVMGTGVPSQIQLQPAALAFGSVPVGTKSAAQSIVASNTAPVGGTTASLQTPVVTSDYQIQGTTCSTTLAPQSSCTTNVLFAPTKEGPDSGTFTIATAVEAQLSGSGLAPATDTLAETSLTFASQAVGTASAAKTVTLKNTGDVALTAISATSSLADFKVNAAACATNLPGGASCAITVYFAPVEPGLRKGSLAISDSLHSGSTALLVALNGTGTAPAGVVSMSPSSLDFGSEGTPLTPPLVPSQPLTLTNNSRSAVTGLSFATTGDFAVSVGTCSSSLAAGASCSPSVVFTPTTTGPRNGVLTALGTNLGSVLTTTLAGIGLDYTMSVSGATSVTVVTGTPAAYLVAIAPTGQSSGLLALNCTSAPVLPAGSSCVANPEAVQLTSGVTGSVGVVVKTPALATSSWLNWRASGWMLAFVLPFFRLCQRRLILTGISRSMLLLLAMAIAGGLAGCGAKASGGSVGTGGTGTTGGGVPPSSYVLTVTASAPGIQRSVSLTMKLEQ